MLRYFLCLSLTAAFTVAFVSAVHAEAPRAHTDVQSLQYEFGTSAKKPTTATTPTKAPTTTTPTFSTDDMPVVEIVSTTTPTPVERQHYSPVCCVPVYKACPPCYTPCYYPCKPRRVCIRPAYCMPYGGYW